MIEGNGGSRKAHSERIETVPSHDVWDTLHRERGD
jgi:hypothetical protein